MRWLLVLAVLVFVAPAHADRWPVAQVQRAVQVADNHWPDSACYGRHDIEWLTEDELIAQTGEGGAGLGVETPEQAAYYGACKVWIAWDAAGLENPAMLCTVLEHEFGHNAGVGHSDGVMAWMLFFPSRDCRDAFYVPRGPRLRWRHWP